MVRPRPAGIASRLIHALALGTALLAATAVAAPAVLAGGGCHAAAETIPAEGSSVTVRLEGCTFVPTITRVPVGAEVRFVNTSFGQHDITGRMYAWGSELLDSGESYAHRFMAAGLYPYSCSLHPGMAGVVVASDAGAAAVGAGQVTDQPSGGEGAGSDSVGLIVGFVSLAALAGLALILRKRAAETSRRATEASM